MAKKKFISVDRRSALRRIEMSLFGVYFRFGGVGGSDVSCENYSKM